MNTTGRQERSLVRGAWDSIFGSRHRRIVALLSAAPLAAALLVGVQLAAGNSSPKLIGTTFGKEQAPGFQLRDKDGQGYSLSQFRGKVVVLAFLYTHCPDLCPLTAEILRHADEAASHPSDVVYVAVSVDPTGDTPDSIATFTAEHHLDELGDRWHYLVGSLPELEGVWKSYYMYAPADPSLPAGVGHSTGLFFIDRQGNRRVYTSLPFSVEDVARNELALTKH